jgi:hypothetical protein
MRELEIFLGKDTKMERLVYRLLEASPNLEKVDISQADHGNELWFFYPFPNLKNVRASFSFNTPLKVDLVRRLVETYPLLYSITMALNDIDFTMIPYLKNVEFLSLNSTSESPVFCAFLSALLPNSRIRSLILHDSPKIILRSIHNLLKNGVLSKLRTFHIRMASEDAELCTETVLNETLMQVEDRSLWPSTMRIYNARYGVVFVQGQLLINSINCTLT